MSMSNNRVFIVGQGALTSLGTANETYAALLLKKSGVSKIKSFDVDRVNCKSKIAAEIDPFNVQQYSLISKAISRRYGRPTLIGLAAAQMALESSGLWTGDKLLPQIRLDRVGAFVSAGFGFGQYDDYHGFLNQKGSKAIPPHAVIATMENSLASLLTILTKSTGENYSIGSACSSSLFSIGEAYRKIKNGILDMAFVGGSECPITPVVVSAFSNLMALSRSNHIPATACKPFDKNRNGFAIGEGAAIMILANERVASESQSTPILEIIGFGCGSDAHHITETTKHGIEKAIRNALNDAQLSHGKIGFINTHGTGTKKNDINEGLAIESVFTQKNGKPQITSIKGSVGHTINAAGAINMVMTSLAHQKGTIPPINSLVNPDPALNISLVRESNCNLDSKYSLTNAFGFGGASAAICSKSV